MSIENVTPHTNQITVDSSADEVLQWFQGYKKGKYLYLWENHFQLFDGGELLGLSEEQFKENGIPGMVASALWNALHPDDVEMGVQDEELPTLEMKKKILHTEAKEYWEKMKQRLPGVRKNLERRLPDTSENPDIGESFDFFNHWENDSGNFVEEFSPNKCYFENFPELRVLPKFFKKKGRILVREEYLSVFETLRYYDKENLEGNRNYGTYLYGPNGIGKSICLYSIACFAYSLEWLVLYVPDCDRWCSYVDEPEMFNHILSAMFFGFYQHQERIPDIIEDTLNGLTSDDLREKKKMYEKVLKKLEKIREMPVLLIFDEQNAIFSTELKCFNYLPAYKHPLFRATASTLNILDMSRGLKLISGTGHSEGLKHLAKGCEKYTHYLTLPMEDELKDMILKTNLIPDNPQRNLIGLSKNEVEFGRVLKMIISVLGSIPREVRAFGNYVDRSAGQSSYTVPFWFEMIKKFAGDNRDLVFQIIVDFTSNFDELHRKEFTRNLYNMLYGDSIKITLSFVDLSLIHQPSRPGPYRPVSQIATMAMADFVRVHGANEEDIDHILNPLLSNSEVSLAFERLIMSNLFGSDKLLQTYDVEHKPASLIDLGWYHKISFDSLEQLLQICVLDDTLLVPPKSFAMLDFIVVKTSVDPPVIYVCQVTLQGHHKKLPKTDTSYRGFFDAEFMENHFPNSNIHDSLSSLLAHNIVTQSSLEPVVTYVILSGKTRFETSPDQYQGFSDEMMKSILIVYGYGLKDLVSEAVIIKTNDKLKK